MGIRKLSVVLAVVIASAGIGVGFAAADQSSPSTGDCQVQAGQNGVNEEGATANAVSTAAGVVAQEAGSGQSDDQAGDQQGPNDQSNEEGESNQCGEQGQHGDEGQSGDQSDGQQDGENGNG